MRATCLGASSCTAADTLQTTSRCSASSVSFLWRWTHHRRFSTSTKVQCSHTYVKVIVRLPSASPTACLRKSVLCEMIRSSWNHGVHHDLPMPASRFRVNVSFVQAGKSASTSLPPFRAFANRKRSKSMSCPFTLLPLCHLLSTRRACRHLPRMATCTLAGAFGLCVLCLFALKTLTYYTHLAHKKRAPCEAHQLPLYSSMRFTDLWFVPLCPSRTKTTGTN